MTSGRGERLSKGFASGGRKPSGRSASSSTRCCTPMVIFLPQTGQRPPYAAVWDGVRRHPQADARPGGIFLLREKTPLSRQTLRQSGSPWPARVGKIGIQQIGFPSYFRWGMGVGIGNKSKPVQCGDPPVHGRVGGKGRSPRHGCIRKDRRNTLPPCQNRKRRRT